MDIRGEVSGHDHGFRVTKVTRVIDRCVHPFRCSVVVAQSPESNGCERISHHFAIAPNEEAMTVIAVVGVECCARVEMDNGFPTTSKNDECRPYGTLCFHHQCSIVEP